MDVIYTDSYRQDVGVLKDYTFDLAFGKDENDFELSLDVNNHCCTEDCLVYIEGTEYGGIIDAIGVVTKDEKLTYKGRTWHGILASKIITPNTGEAYFTVSGELNQVIGSVIERIGLTDMFVASEENSLHSVTNYSFDRYCDAYAGIKKMVASADCKLKFEFKNGKVVLSALPIVDYSQDEQFDNDQVEMQIEKTYNHPNHLICLGKGELEKRTYIHLYMHENGEVKEYWSSIHHGLTEITAVYDYPNAESLAELKKSGIEKLKEYAAKDTVKMDFTSEDNIYDIGDIVGAKEITTGIVAREKITKKIVTINQGVANINYEVGE